MTLIYRIVKLAFVLLYASVILIMGSLCSWSPEEHNIVVSGCALSEGCYFTQLVYSQQLCTVCALNGVLWQSGYFNVLRETA